jgi:ribosomal protein S18 acetylase RimI-like enzyme
VEVLAALPDWFGIPQANVDYTRAVGDLPTWVATFDGSGAGFLSIKQHFPWAAEVYVMGVLPRYHRLGIGRALLAAAEGALREQGVEYLQVKTLSARHPDPLYARTRGFYAAVGFRPLEDLPALWGEENPCLLLVKKI